LTSAAFRFSLDHHLPGCSYNGFASGLANLARWVDFGCQITGENAFLIVKAEELTED